jgi:hypothetical protein
MLCIDIFKFDATYLENEEKYKAIRAEILGEDSDHESGSSEESEESEDEGLKKLHYLPDLLTDIKFQLPKIKKASKTGRRRTWSIYAA